MASKTTATKTKGILTSVENFIRNMLGLDEGVGSVGVFLSAVLVLIGFALLALIVVRSYGVGHSNLAAISKGKSHFPGIFLFLIIAAWGWLNFSSRVPFKVSNMAFALSIVAGLLTIVLLNTN